MTGNDDYNLSVKELIQIKNEIYRLGQLVDSHEVIIREHDERLSKKDHIVVDNTKGNVEKWTTIAVVIMSAMIGVILGIGQILS